MATSSLSRAEDTGRIMPNQPQARDAKSCEQEANCILVGKFLKIEEVKVSGRDVAPRSASVGAFEVTSKIKPKGRTCDDFAEKFDVIFGTNKIALKQAYGWSDMNVLQPEVGKSYKVYLRDYGIVSPACYGWLRPQ